MSGKNWQERLFGDPEIEDLFADQATYDSWLRFEVALTLALADVGIADAAKAEAVAAAMKSFIPEAQMLQSALLRDGLPVPEWVRQLKAHVGTLGEGIVHHGATSQDLIDTATVLAFLEALDIFEMRLSRLTAVFDVLAHANDANRLMAFTRMQPALSIRARDRIAIWHRPIDMAAAKIPTLRKVIGRLQFGGAVGTLEALGAVGPEVARHLGERLHLPWPDHCWHTDRTALADFANHLSVLTGTLGKFGQDVALIAMRGPQIAISGGGSSSAMPHKKNPILAEKLVTLARYNATLLSGMHLALVHEEERSGGPWALEWMILPKMAVATGAAITAATNLASSIERIGEPAA